MTQFEPIESDEDDEDNYKGSSGYVIVAVGERDRACYLRIDPNFGALRWFVAEGGLEDPQDAGLMPDGDYGVYKATARAWTSHSWEAGDDMGFTLTSKWEQVWDPDGQ